MTDKQKDFAVELSAGAILLLLGVFVIATRWPNWLKAVVVIGIVLLSIIAVVLVAPVGTRIRARAVQGSRHAPPPAPPTLVEQLDETWFVTFTSGPYPAGSDGLVQYATAIAAVDRVEGDEVVLRWRDKGSFPARVPIKLLEATRVYRFRGDGDDRRRVRVENDGLRVQGPGGVVTGSGWRAHQRSPHQIAFSRCKDLSSEDKMVMEADADLGSYDLEGL
ncbi:MAG: hypothetical protein JNK12_20360 [Acidimicrobiales bacterium]|nr:hypothetical protein [Acidimicrobiales bacterium]